MLCMLASGSQWCWLLMYIEFRPAESRLSESRKRKTCSAWLSHPQASLGGFHAVWGGDALSERGGGNSREAPAPNRDPGLASEEGAGLVATACSSSSARSMRCTPCNRIRRRTILPVISHEGFRRKHLPVVWLLLLALRILGGLSQGSRGCGLRLRLKRLEVGPGLRLLAPHLHLESERLLLRGNPHLLGGGLRGGLGNGRGLLRPGLGLRPGLLPDCVRLSPGLRLQRLGVRQCLRPDGHLLPLGSLGLLLPLDLLLPVVLGLLAVLLRASLLLFLHALQGSGCLLARLHLSAPLRLQGGLLSGRLGLGASRRLLLQPRLRLGVRPRLHLPHLHLRPGPDDAGLDLRPPLRRLHFSLGLGLQLRRATPHGSGLTFDARLHGLGLRQHVSIHGSFGPGDLMASLLQQVVDHGPGLRDFGDQRCLGLARGQRRGIGEVPRLRGQRVCLGLLLGLLRLLECALGLRPLALELLLLVAHLALLRRKQLLQLLRLLQLNGLSALPEPGVLHDLSLERSLDGLHLGCTRALLCRLVPKVCHDAPKDLLAALQRLWLCGRGRRVLQRVRRSVRARRLVDLVRPHV
mmetsp:Transcript_33371/g.88349  ORF Transcript_33371/g.88349 Transcript_33371/m.88349 type:complete len:579 (-) Transcript_33371:23-1759(-)